MKIAVAVTSQTMSSINKVAVPIEIIRRIPPDVILADEPIAIDTNLEVDMMLGNDYYDDVVTGKKTQLAAGVWLLDSDFGWIISGRVSDEANRTTQIHHILHNNMGMQVLVDNDCINTLEAYSFASPDLPGSLEDMWNLEAIGIRDESNPVTDDEAIDQFNKTVKFEDGRYQVTFPWNSNESMLPDNRALAMRRLCSLINRMQRHNRYEFLDRYDKIIKDQMQKGIIEIVSNESTTNKVHYLPHHGVETPQKTTTKLRIVYDASAKDTPSLPSLNDCIHRGQVFLQDLLALLMRFRFHRIAIVADIEKAFLQIGLQSHERDVTRFLWVKNVRKPFTDDNIICLRFARVLFGVNTSPFLLGATVKHHLNHHTSTFAKQIDDNLYSDNVITGVNEIPKAVDFYTESKQIFTEAGMNLREFGSNNPEFLSYIPETDRVTEDTVKVLGMRWQRSSDQLFVPVPDEFPSILSKKVMLSNLFRIYDPMGFVSPITVRGKMLLQALCKKKIQWNQNLPVEDKEVWTSLTNDLQKISSIRIPRYLGFSINETTRLMCFVDASENAYAAVVYIQDGQKKSNILFAKARVSPLKKQSIPRLELMAVVIGVRAIDFIRRKLPFNGRVVLWSDSQCVLQWLQTKRITGRFVTNRIKEIRSGKEIEFRYVPSKDNPADLASRGVSYSDLTVFWWLGPAWMNLTEDLWPNWADNPLKLSVMKDEDLDEVAMITIPQEQRPVLGISLSDYSTIARAVRVTAWCLRFTRNIRQKVGRRQSRFLQPDEIRNARLMWIQNIQQAEYADLLKCIQNNHKHPTAEQLGVRFDEDKILRCYGRLANMDADEDTKFPILLPSKSRFTNLIIEESHIRSMHAKVGQTLATTRQSFWIPKGRSRVKSVVSRCKVCRLYDGGAFQRPRMPELPTSRVTRSRPFQNTGLDYFGPLYTRQFRESRETTKIWVCIFTCFTTRAIHLEVVNDQSAMEFLLAIRRFMARRGKPETILSDNAAQFKAVKLSEAIDRFSSDKAIRWTFIPPYAPWAGGLYERQIKNVKSAMRKTIGRCLLSDSQLHTITTEVESTVNSRPITYIGDDPDDWAPLSPNDLLGLTSESFLPPKDDHDPDYSKGIMSTRESIVQLYKRHQNVMNEFWRIWQNEYLLSLRDQTHWTHKDPSKRIKDCPKVGQVVLVKSIGCPRNHWKLGKVIAPCKSHDNAVRAVRIQLPSKTVIVRPVNLLYPVETSPEKEDDDKIDRAPEEEADAKNDRHKDASKDEKDVTHERPVRKAAHEARKRWQRQIEDDDTSSLGSVSENQTY